MDLRRVIQFFFYEQWHALRRYCAQRSIRVVGDIAIFVAYDSADVWAHRDLFRLRKDDLEPEAVSGVPPDAFSATGQRWGTPLYDWDAIRARGYDWWIDRLRWGAQTCDYIRLDHFRGFEQFWEIPANEPTAVNGRWVDGPKDELFNKLRDVLGGLPFFAEDLGYITPEVHALRERHQIPGSGGAAVWFLRRRRPCLSAAPPHAGSRRLYRHARQRHHAGLVEVRRIRERAARDSSLCRATAKTASTGLSFVWRRSRWRAWRWSRCRMCWDWAAKPA